MTKTRKARRGLLFSLLTLAVALMVTATSTYAWFVVNREVTASNMQVTVTADTTYLVIKKSATEITSTADLGTEISQDMGGAGTTVLPVRYNETATVSSPDTKWETSSGTNYTTGTAATGTTHVLTESEIEPSDANAYRYYSHYTFYVGLTPTSLVGAHHLRVSALTATANGSSPADFYLPAVSAVVTCKQGSTALGTNDYEDITTIGQNSRPALTDTTAYPDLSADVDLTKVYTIDVYLYINGDNALVTSENAAKLGGFTVLMKLSIV